MTTVNQMAKDVFANAVKEAISELRTKALNSGVQTEQIDAVIAGVYVQAGNYSFTMAVRKVQSALNNLIRAANAETLIGVFVGSRDKVGKQTPIKYTLLTTDKKHLEISNFGTTAPYQGQKIEIPVPALVTIRAEHDSEFDSWNLIAIEKYQILETKEQIIKVLSKVVIPISAINGDYAYKHGEHAGRPVVISGTIGRISPEVVFKYEDDEEGGRTATLDHQLPVICSREINKNEFLPCFAFNVNSKTRGTNFTRCHLQQMRNGTPTLLVPDVSTICRDAVSRVKEPDGQAAVLSEWLYDLPVLVVGVVDRYKRTVSESKSEQNRIDIGVTCVVDIEGMTVDGSGAQKTIDQKPQAPAAGPHITTQTAPVDAAPAAAKKAPKKASQPAPAAPAAEEKSADDLAAEFSAAAASGLGDESAPPAEAAVEETTPAQPPAAAAPAAKKAEKKAKSAPAAAAAAPAATKSAVDVPPQKINEIVRAIKFWCQISGLKATDVTVEMLRKKALDIVGDIPDSIIEATIIRAGKE